MLRKLSFKGFTMIELLVVIAVIGILSVALLATLNPLEQIKKGRDTRTRSDVSQLVSAIERYNASLGYFPWQTAEGQDLVGASADVPFIPINGGTTVGGVAIDAVLDQLTTTNEVKSSFIDRITSATAADIYLYYNDEVGGASAIACFTPESNTFQREAFDRCKAGATAFSTDMAGIVYGPGHPCPGADAASYTTFNAASVDEMICLP